MALVGRFFCARLRQVRSWCAALPLASCETVLPSEAESNRRNSSDYLNCSRSIWMPHLWQVVASGYAIGRLCIDYGAEEVSAPAMVARLVQIAGSTSSAVKRWEPSAK